MPQGVEHPAFTDTRPGSRTGPPRSMPQGVEHVTVRSSHQRQALVHLASMPRGVEHLLTEDGAEHVEKQSTSLRCRKAWSTTRPPGSRRAAPTSTSLRCRKAPDNFFAAWARCQPVAGFVVGGLLISWVFNPVFAASIVAFTNAGWTFESYRTSDPREAQIASSNRGPLVAAIIGIGIAALPFVLALVQA